MPKSQIFPFTFPIHSASVTSLLINLIIIIIIIIIITFPECTGVGLCVPNLPCIHSSKSYLVTWAQVYRRQVCCTCVCVQLSIDGRTVTNEIVIELWCKHFLALFLLNKIKLNPFMVFDWLCTECRLLIKLLQCILLWQ